MLKSITLMALFSVSMAEKHYHHASKTHEHGHKNKTLVPTLNVLDTQPLPSTVDDAKPKQDSQTPSQSSNQFLANDVKSWFDQRKDSCPGIVKCQDCAFSECSCGEPKSTCPSGSLEANEQCFKNNFEAYNQRAFNLGEGEYNFTASDGCLTAVNIAFDLLPGQTEGLQFINKLDKNIDMKIDVPELKTLKLFELTQGTANDISTYKLTQLDDKVIKLNLKPDESKSYYLYDCDKSRTETTTLKLKAERKFGIIGLQAMAGIFLTVVALFTSMA
ncbi:UNKNOWN [Stylonychia lemnae]|uniref:Uncharacterized protein n=1 Tax=Stylonychia lemnae TaxID=5949 RepID=A0A078B684_STYLE|nr:UNKNOWN [Stylonychia lemnae]|eukprot:CDW90035.1 UNKNOWN [Stylonychia lemnae]